MSGFSSAKYWNDRYLSGQGSGVGSHGASARFKANFLNSFVKQHDVQSVIEFGCGDGNQLALAHYPEYVGVDVSVAAIELCEERFRDDPSKEFFLGAPGAPPHRYDLALSLDVIYHLVEDVVYDDHLRDVFGSSRRWVVLYTTDTANPVANNDHVAAHVKHRPVLYDVQSRMRAWTFVAAVDAPDGCVFYVFEKNLRSQS